MTFYDNPTFGSFDSMADIIIDGTNALNNEESTAYTCKEFNDALLTYSTCDSCPKPLKDGDWTEYYIGGTEMLTDDTDAMLNCLASPYINNSTGLTSLTMAFFYGAQTAYSSVALNALLDKTPNIETFLTYSLIDTPELAKQSLFDFAEDVVESRPTLKSV